MSLFKRYFHCEHQHLIPTVASDNFGMYYCLDCGKIIRIGR